MIIPRLKKDYEKKKVEELIKEQQLIMNEIINYENKYILNDCENKVIDEVIISDPSPIVKWRVLSEDLIMLTKLIDEKTRDDNGIGFEL